MGGPIDAIFSGESTRRWQLRVEDLLKQLRTKCEQVNEDKLDRNFIESDEFDVLVISIIQALQKTHEQEKISIYVNILTQACNKGFSDEYRKERFLYLVERLSMIHIHILKMYKELLSDNFSDDYSSNIILTSLNIAEHLGIDRYDCDIFCLEIVSVGLLFDPFIGTTNYKRGSYALHKSATKFFQFLFENP